MLSIPSKLMEKQVSRTITEHIENHPGLTNTHQWTYKKNQSTESFLLYMTESWRKAADQKKVVGIVFIDFKKLGLSIPSHMIN